MRRALLHFTFGAALVLLATASAQAMGFGRSVTTNTLGQSLDFSVQLALDGEDAAELPCVAAEVRAGDARLAPELVRATIEMRRETGERRIRVTTKSAIDEPVVTVDVTVGCTSRLSRRFVAFIDPPALRLASVERDEFVPQRVDSQVKPLLDVVNAGQRTRRAAAAVAPSRRGETRARPIVAVARQGPRLRLEPAPAVVAARVEPAALTASAAVPTGAAATLATAAASAPGADGAADAIAKERARIAELEAALATLRTESQHQQKSLAALQARLRDAESERHASGQVVVLAIALLVAIALGAAMSALRRHQRNRARWFEEQTRQLRRESVAELPADAEPPVPRVSQPPSGWNDGPPSNLAVTAPASIGGLEVTTVLAPQSHYARLAQQESSANSALRSSAPATSPMDELADLEQQAEFFAAIGQDDAATALLEAHLHRAGGGSALPYLHLLEIHRRRGDRDAFDRARREHGPRFAAAAADWDGTDASARALEGHARAIASLQALWATPPEAMRLLEALAARPGDDNAAFDLAAYRDLLLLYAVARDLAMPPEADNGTIDLYLPLDDAPTEPLRPDAHGDAVDVDVSSWTDMADEERVIRLAAGRRGAG